MLEYIPLQCQVFHVIGGYDEFALTDAGAYYIPISGGSPLKPGSVEFRRISSGAISSITPVAITEGVIYVDSTLRQIYSISATGQISRPYQVADITEYPRDLFDNIQSIAASTTDPTIAGRQIYAVNGDGTFVVGKFESSREYVGWFKQYSAGQVKHISSRYDSVIFSVDYGGLHVAEVIDKSASMDCQVNLLTSGAEGLLTLSTGEVLQFSTGHAFQLDEFLLNDFAGQTMQVMADGFYLGDYMIPAGGEVALSGDYVNVSIGFKFDVEVEPLIEDLEGGDNQKQRLRRRKIQKSLMVVKDTQIFRVGSRVYGTYRQGENMDLPVVSRDDTYQHRQPGRSWDPTFRIVQDVPGGFELLELTTEVTV